MHILHIYKDYPPILGGIENHVQLLAQAQAAAGHDVTVLVTNPAGPRYPLPWKPAAKYPCRPAGDGHLHATERRLAVATPAPRPDAVHLPSPLRG